jgi:hypothetical protein
MTTTSRLRRRVGMLLAAAASVPALVSCGGDGTATPDAVDRPAYNADKLIQQASGPNAAARSGRIDASVKLTLKGNADYAEPFSSSVTGPFQYRKGSALPDYELELGVRNYGVELSSVNGRSYISLGESGYALPLAVRHRLLATSARGENGLTRTLEQFGIAPWRWETEKRAGAIARTDGATVVRIDTSFNAGRMLKDANTLLGLLASLGITRAVGLPAQITRRARRAFVRAVTSKVGASYVGISDHVIRQSGFTMTFSVPKADRKALGGISGGTISGNLHVTEIGRPQQIHAPQTVAPFAQLALAIDALGDARE